MHDPVKYCALNPVQRFYASPLSALRSLFLSRFAGTVQKHTLIAMANTDLSIDNHTEHTYRVTHRYQDVSDSQ